MSFEQLFAELNQNTSKMSETLAAIKGDTSRSLQLTQEQLGLQKDAASELRRDSADTEKEGGAAEPNIAELLEELSEKLDGKGGGNNGLLGGLLDLVKTIAGGAVAGAAGGIFGGMTAAGIAALGKGIGLGLAGAVGAYLREQDVKNLRDKENEEDDDSTVTPEEFKDGERPGSTQLYREHMYRNGLGGAFQTGGFVYPSPVQAFQSGGGVFKVPGNSTGDNHNMLLPQGSFVLNRNASKALTRQDGGYIPPPLTPLGFQEGNMVPVKTESQEMIFGPGSWSSLIPVLNSVIPRFQAGGLVEASHPDTGPGWQPSGILDANGRPLVLNKEGAAAFARAIKESGGLVKGSDVASAQRSQAKNASLHGAHPNSTHLYGEGLDASGTTAAWLRENPQLGWVEGYTHGDSGTSWHFNWKGASSTGKDSYTTDGSNGSGANSISSPGDMIGSIQTSLGDGNMGMGNFDPTAVIGSIQKVLSSGNELGIATLLGGGLGAVMGGIGSMFGDMFSGITNALGLGGGGSSPSATGLGAPEITGGTKGLLDFIAHYESGGDYNKIFGGESIPGLTNMTIREVVEVQKRHNAKGYESAAIGRYQMMRPDIYAKEAGLTLDDKFSQENQDKMAMVYLEEDGLTSYLSGQMSADTFANNVAGTWAAMPTESGVSYHEGVGSNKALVDRETYMKAIRAAKTNQANLGDGTDGSFGLGTHGRGRPSDGKQMGGLIGIPFGSMSPTTQGRQTGGSIGGLEPVKVESGELIFPPGSYGSEIPMLNESIPRFQGGGMTGSLGISGFDMQSMIGKRFCNTNETQQQMSHQQQQPIVIPMPMGMDDASNVSDGFGGGSPIPSLTSSPSNHIVSALMMSSYSLQQRIG